MSQPPATARGERMRRFWDRRAREDAPFFVDDRLAYGAANFDRLFSEGDEVLRTYQDLVGLEIRATDRVLEIGCGVGRVTRALAAQASEVIALDVSQEMLARARELNDELENVTWLLGDGTSLADVGDATVDRCFSHVVFQHIPDPEVTLGYVREMGRVLRPGGIAAFQVSNDPAVHRPRDPSVRTRLARLALVLTRRAPRGTASPYWLGSAVDLDALHRAAAAGGMAVERLVGARTQFCVVRTRRSEDEHTVAEGALDRGAHLDDVAEGE